MFDSSKSTMPGENGPLSHAGMLWAQGVPAFILRTHWEEFIMLLETGTTQHVSGSIQPPEVGSAILYRGMGNAICEGVVTQIKHIPTRHGDQWGVFLDTVTGPIFINDWRYLCVK